MSKIVVVDFTDRGIVDHENSTNTLAHSDIRAGEFSLEWELLNNSTVDKFLKVHEAINAEREIHWNRYVTHNEVTNEDPNADAKLSKFIAQLNTEISRAIQLFEAGEITVALKVSATDTTDEMLTKLNNIHYIFETKLMSLTGEDKLNSPEIVENCEKLNQLVHSIEPFYNKTNLSDTRFFTVLRQEHPPSKSTLCRIEADDEDYKRFQTDPEDGDMYSDFYTVGKDMWAAWYTNDVELIKSRSVHQQCYISGSVNFMFDKIKFQKYCMRNPYAKYRQWCHDNKVIEYGYDVTQPRYNMGRAKLGRLINPGFDYIMENLEKYPNVCNIRIRGA